MPPEWETEKTARSRTWTGRESVSGRLRGLFLSGLEDPEHGAAAEGEPDPTIVVDAQDHPVMIVVEGNHGAVDPRRREDLVVLLQPSDHFLPLPVLDLL